MNTLTIEPLAHNLFAVRAEHKGKITRFLSFETKEEAEKFMKQVIKGRKANEVRGNMEEENQEEKCKRGEHNFVECDDWEPTCSFCGKFE